MVKSDLLNYMLA